MTTGQPRTLTDDVAQDSGVVITMGCGDTCPYYSGKRYEDREPIDSAGKGVNFVRPIRDHFRARIQQLIGQLLPTGAR